MSAPVNTVSNAVVNLLSRSRIKNRKRSARSPRSISKVAGLLGDLSSVGWAVVPARCTRSRPCSTARRR